MLGAIAMVTIVGGGVAQWVLARPSLALANVEVSTAEALPVHTHNAEHEVAPPALVEPSIEERYPIPMRNGAPLDEVFTSLRGWVYPVTNPDFVLPPLDTAHFGAERKGVERSECRRGHCGIDLHGPIGKPLVAVADGVVIRVERKRLGSDGRSGRYVRLQHDDGALTAYMHMDKVAPGLEVGDTVRRGQFIGTLGNTAVFSAAPHLHFSIELPKKPGLKGNKIATRYINPAPFLVRAEIVKTPERRRPIKPAT